MSVPQQLPQYEIPDNPFAIQVGGFQEFSEREAPVRKLGKTLIAGSLLTAFVSHCAQRGLSPLHRQVAKSFARGGKVAAVALFLLGLVTFCKRKFLLDDLERLATYNEDDKITFQEFVQKYGKDKLRAQLRHAHSNFLKSLVLDNFGPLRETSEELRENWGEFFSFLGISTQEQENFFAYGHFHQLVQGKIDYPTFHRLAGLEALCTDKSHKELIERKFFEWAQGKQLNLCDYAFEIQTFKPKAQWIKQHLEQMSVEDILSLSEDLSNQGVLHPNLKGCCEQYLSKKEKIDLKHRHQVADAKGEAKAQLLDLEEAVEEAKVQLDNIERALRYPVQRQRRNQHHGHHFPQLIPQPVQQAREALRQAQVNLEAKKAEIGLAARLVNLLDDRLQAEQALEEQFRKNLGDYVLEDAIASAPDVNLLYPHLNN